MASQQHTSDARVLNARTLRKDFRLLAELVKPGMRVLDAGCGTGAITAGIAELGAEAVGVDRDRSLLAQAPVRDNLRFVAGDLLTSSFEAEFDIAATARCLQWIDGNDLGAAVSNLVKAVRPGGLVVVLDYDHTSHAWRPEPPPEFRGFFDAFLAWRDAHRWRNAIARELPDMLRKAGLIEVTEHCASEWCGAEDSAAGIWPHVMESLGPKMIEEGYWTEAERSAALDVSRDWVRSAMTKQVLYLSAVEGRRPPL
jgi:SAM-dependent methyltransferase